VDSRLLFEGANFSRGQAGGAIVQEACPPAAPAQIDLFDRDRVRVHWAVGRRDQDGFRHIGFGSVVLPRGHVVALACTKTRAGSTVPTPNFTETNGLAACAAPAASDPRFEIENLRRRSARAATRPTG